MMAAAAAAATTVVGSTNAAPLLTETKHLHRKYMINLPLKHHTLSSVTINIQYAQADDLLEV